MGVTVRVPAGILRASTPTGAPMITSSLLALALATPDAEAASVPKIKNIRVRDLAETSGQRSLVATTSGSDSTVASIEAELESDAGDQSVTLAESDAWLHGAAPISALPKTDATVTLTVYDRDSVSLGSISGTLHASKERGTGWISWKSAVWENDVSDTGRSALDLEVLAVDVFPATKGYDVAFDLAGADTYDVAYATLVVTEGRTTTKAELGWGDVGAIWEGELAEELLGQVKVKATTYDSKAKKIDSAKVELAAPWADGGAGLAAIPTDDDPLTTVSLHDVGELADILKADYGIEPAALTVVSEGWTAGDTLPVEASVELTGGSTLSVPVNSYQRAVFGSAYGDWKVSATNFASTEAGLASELPVTVTLLDAKGNVIYTEDVEPSFDDEIAVVFSYAVSLAEDPFGLGLAGKVSLLGASNQKGKQETLSKGTFYSDVSRNEDGALGLAGADEDAVSARGDILIGGEPIGFELTDSNKDGVITTPPAILMQTDSGTPKPRRVLNVSGGTDVRCC